MVDKFGVKYVGKENADHLITAIRGLYPVAEDWTGKLHCGITLKLDYQKCTFDIFMSGYMAVALNKYQNSAAQRKQHSPHQC